jgi:hypothetical protein
MAFDFGIPLASIALVEDGFSASVAMRIALRAKRLRLWSEECP